MSRNRVISVHGVIWSRESYASSLELPIDAEVAVSGRRIGQATPKL